MTSEKGPSEAVRVGSACSGYGGLELGLITALGAGSVAWHAEIEPGPAAVLSARFPGVPNLGDITTTDWTTVEPVDWFCAGFPCQPASAAGKRQGMTDERWLWDAVARAVEGVRPRRVLLENVPGLFSVDRGRAFERVICDLAALGYVGRYGVVRASDAGAPHGRARVFIVASDAAERGRWGSEGQQRGLGAAGCLPHALADADEREGGQRHDPDVLGRRAGEAEQTRLGDRAVTDTGRLPGHAGWVAAPGQAAGGRPQREPSGRSGAPATDADIAGLQGAELARRRLLLARGATADTAGDSGRVSDRDDVSAGGQEPRWGVYEPAIRRWERVTGRAAPSPTEPGQGGKPRLSPQFVEWLQGLAVGWVTEVQLPRNVQLKCLGNGVVPQQAALAVSVLCHKAEVAA